MLVGDIMKRDVKTASPEESVAEVAKIMHRNGISSVVVVDGEELAGIVTERDIVNLVASGGDPQATPAKHGMTKRNIETVTPKTDIAEATELMVARNIRHLPVTDKRGIVGIISIRDLTRWAAEELAGGHEMPDIRGSHAALSAAAELQRKRNES